MEDEPGVLSTNRSRMAPVVAGLAFLTALTGIVVGGYVSRHAAATLSPCPWELVSRRKLGDLGLNQTLKVLVGHLD